MREQICPQTDVEVKLLKLVKPETIKRLNKIRHFKPPRPKVVMQVARADVGKAGAVPVRHFKCPHAGCDKVQRRNTDYRTHYFTHTNIWPYPCRPLENGGAVCEKAFRDASTRCRHEATHTRKVVYVTVQSPLAALAAIWCRCMPQFERILVAAFG